MINIVEGVPGSGKSYYGVNYLIKNFFDYDDFYNEYIEKNNKSVLVISNIEGLKVKHLNLDDLINRFTVEKFFTVSNFEKIQKQFKVKNIVILIDEAQRYFDRKFFDKDVFYFFQYHRHLGIDIFLFTQNKLNLAREIVVLSEFIISAVPRSKQLGSFKYKFCDTKGNHLYSKTLKKDKKVFNAYQSFKVDEISKPKSVYRSLAVSLALALLFTAGAAYIFKTTFFNPKIIQGGQVVEKDKIEKEHKENIEKDRQFLEDLQGRGDTSEKVKSFSTEYIQPYQVSNNYYCIVDDKNMKSCYKISFSSPVEEEKTE